MGQSDLIPDGRRPQTRGNGTPFSARHLLTRAITLTWVIFLGVLLFIAAEIAAFALVAGQIGFLWALAILLVVSALGPFIVRRVGVGVMVHTQQRLARGEVPTRELLDGLVVLLGGVLICVPGFITDALGLLLMIGAVRHSVIRAAGHRLARRVQSIRLGGRWITDVRPPMTGHRPVSPPDPSGPALGPGDERGL